MWSETSRPSVDLSEFEELSEPALSAGEAARVAQLKDLLATDPIEMNEYPSGTMSALIGAGYLVEALPTQSGGHGASITAAARMLEEISKFNGSLGWLMNVQYGLHFLLPTLTNGQPERYFMDVVEDHALFAGSPGKHRASLTADGRHVNITGTIRYSSGAPLARWVTTTAQVTTEGRPRGCTLMIASNSDGLRCDPAPYLHGMRGSHTGLVHLHNVMVPAEHVHFFRDLDDPASRPEGCRYFGAWHSLLLQNAVFLGVAWTALVASLGALKVRARTVPLRERTLLEAAVGAAASELLQARSLFYARVQSLELAALHQSEQAQANRPGHLAALSAVANLAYSAVSRAIEQVGGSALVGAGLLERCWRDVQLARVAEGSRHDSAQVVLGQQLLGPHGPSD